MKDRVTDDTRLRVLNLVRQILADNSIETAFTIYDRLADIGLRSMDMVSLMLGIEAEFDVVIPQDDVTPENFTSVATIETVVARILTAKRVAS